MRKKANETLPKKPPKSKALPPPVKFTETVNVDEDEIEIITPPKIKAKKV